MDKRWYRRDPLVIDVLVYCDGLLVARGQTENLGPGGAYVRLNGLTATVLAQSTLKEGLKSPAAGAHRRRLSAQT